MLRYQQQINEGKISNRKLLKLTNSATATSPLIPFICVTGVFQYCHGSVEILLTEITL